MSFVISGRHWEGELTINGYANSAIRLAVQPAHMSRGLIKAPWEAGVCLDYRAQDWAVVREGNLVTPVRDQDEGCVDVQAETGQQPSRFSDRCL